MNKTVWHLFPPREEAKIISTELGIPLEIAQVLVNRNVTEPETAQEFLFGTLDSLHDPFLMKDMRDAVERIKQGIYKREKILIFGDYDVDGILSVVILHRALESLGAEVDYFIPERLTEGYGIKEEYIKIVLEKKAGLVISVDCGIKALPFAKRAREEGIDVIITDHHIPGDSLPETSAILNPVLQNSGYPDKNLAGVGVVFKLIQALFAREEKSLSLPWYLKLVAIGTVADVGQLRGENRLLVKFGLKALEDVSDPGLSSLMEICQLKGRSVSAGDIGFRIGPRINAAGRMGKTDLALKLFFTNSLPESIELVSHLDELNSRRRRKQEKIYKQALERIKKSSFDDRYRFLILGCEEWHRGVLGIVASKLKDFFHRPVLLFSYENGKAYGSGRTISEFPLIDCLHECKDWLQDYGGHSMAVGCVLERENMTFFRKAVNDFVRSRITDDHLKRKISIDSKIDFTDLTSSFIEKYSLLSPFGAGNPKPVFLTERAEVLGEPKEIKGRHSKLVVNQKGRIFEALGWNRNDWAQNLRRGDIIDLVYSFQFSEYMGEQKFNLSLEDIKT